MSLVDLPVELLDVIFEPLASPTLAALARTNEHLNPSASRLLYRHLALSSHESNLAAVSTLASRPHLASLVRTFAITVGEDAEGVEAEYYVQLSQAVHGMKDLTSLEVHIDATLSWVLLRGPPANEIALYPKLEHFACSFGLDAVVSRFLAGTPSLLSLQLAPSLDHVELPPTAIPCLTTYTGPPTILSQLLSTRPVTSLHLQGDLSLDDISHLAKTISAPSSAAAHECTAYSLAADGDIPSNATIETLSTITSAQPVAVIEALAQACPDLVSLQVITTCPFWQAPDIAFYTRIANALSLLPGLCSFELSGMHWEFRSKGTSAADGQCTEKEWISPPVTPRHDDMEQIGANNNDFDFEDAFMEWAY